MTALAMNLHFQNDGPSFKLDVFSLAIAIAFHIPLYYMKFNASKRVIDHPANRLVAVDLVDQDFLNKPPPPPPPEIKENNLMTRLKMLVHREPPPPPPPPKVEKPEDKLAEGPKEIKLAPKLNLPEPVKPKLENKTGFKTTADSKLIEDKQISIKAPGSNIAPISEKKFGTVTDRGSLKSDKGNFKIAQTESLKSIGGSQGGLVDASAPTIAIRTGSKGSSEQFTAPAPQKLDKGKLGTVGAPGLGNEQKLGFRDSIIARDAAPGQININSSRGSSGGVPGGVDGGVGGGKKDAGRFQGGQTGGIIGGTGTSPGSLASASGARPVVPTKPVEKKSMFTITGPLKDRTITSKILPEYPGWAQAQGIEATVVLEFTVEPNGSVKDSVVVRRTTGYPQLDQVAMKALRKWKFAPITDGENREEVGTITFNFSLE